MKVFPEQPEGHRFAAVPFSICPREA